MWPYFNSVPEATSQLNVLKRLSCSLSADVKLNLYKSFIMAHFNYCPAVWHFCGPKNTWKCEKIQFRDLKYVYQDHTSTYEELLQRSGMPTLEISRLQCIALEVFKCLNGLNPKFMCDLFDKNVPMHNYSLRNQRALVFSQKRTVKNGLHSFSHIGIKIWNSLPNEYRTTTDFKVF